jgi:hypothetical protein
MAQGDQHLPNAAPLESMQRAHPYSLKHQSSQTIVSAGIRMTDHDKRSLTWDQPVRPQRGREIAVPANECLAAWMVKLQSGHTLESGAPDCRQTRITVTDDAIPIGSNGTAGYPAD